MIQAIHHQRDWGCNCQISTQRQAACVQRLWNKWKTSKRNWKTLVSYFRPHYNKKETFFDCLWM